MRKKLWAVFMLLTLSLVLTNGSFAIAAEKVYECKVSSSNSATYPPYRAFTEMIAYLDKNTNGRIKIVKYDDSQLGSQVEALEAMQMGMVQMTMPLTSDLAGFDKRIQVLDLPFLFKDFKSVRKALDGELGKKLDAIYKQQGFLCMAYNPSGIRSVTNNKRPIRKVEDLKGLKIRTMQNPMHIAMFKAMGANPTPLSYSELYTALQQGVVDGQENGPVQIVDAHIEEVQKYYSMTRHLQGVTAVMVSKAWFESLPKDLQKTFKNALKIYEKNITEYTNQYTDECMDKMRKAGVKINELDPGERDKLKKMCLPIYKDFEKVIGKDMIDLAVNSAKSK